MKFLEELERAGEYTARLHLIRQHTEALDAFPGDASTEEDILCGGGDIVVRLPLPPGMHHLRREIQRLSTELGKKQENGEDFSVEEVQLSTVLCSFDHWAEERIRLDRPDVRELLVGIEWTWVVGGDWQLCIIVDMPRIQLLEKGS